ncbi:DUF695 domain-containing protein [Winogradskyella sp.]|uniref:DUF695 domain-containing protein n=1 Tax=Winogradskyella sp. TaxID=1883156 RepID=UPI003BAA1B62
MKLKVLILAMGILSSLFGYGQNKKLESDKIFPKEEFAVVQAKLEDGRPAIGSFNFAYKNYEYKSQYPWCLKIAIGLDLEKCKENGLPEPEETSIANKFEDELLKNIKEMTTSHYVGHLFNDTFLDVYVYLDDPEKVHQWLQTQINKEGLTRGFGYEINEDPKWKTINQFMD